MKRSFMIVALAVSGLLNLAPGQQVWTMRNPGTTNILHLVTYGDSQFVAVGRGPMGIDFFMGTVLSSRDGITWTTQNIDTIWELYSVTYGNSRFVAVGDGGAIISSSDGMTWTIISRPNYIRGTSLTSVAYGNNQFIAVGIIFGFGETLVSSNGSTWTSGSGGYPPRLHSVTCGKNQFVAVGEGGMFTTPDCSTWTLRDSGITKGLVSVIYGGNQYIGVGASGLILSSPDGVTWTRQTAPYATEVFNAVAYGNGQFVAVGNNGTIYTSPDGTNWFGKSSGTTRNLYGVTVSNGLFVVVGDSGTILTSPFSTSGISSYSPALHSVYNGIDFHGNIARYSLSSSSTVSMKLYDTRGRLISELVNRIQNAGEYSIAMPSNIPSGIYVLALKAGNKLWSGEEKLFSR